MSSANWSLPTLTSTYSNFVAEIGSRLDDLALGLDTIPTNLPTGAIQWKSSVSKWQKWDGTSWVDLSTDYAINALTASAWQTGRTITLTGDISYTSPSITGSGNVTAAATLATVNGAVGTYGSTTGVPVITVNAKGLITNVTTATLASMATQAASAVAITGGTLSGITSLNIPSGTGTTGEGLAQWNPTTDKLTIGTGVALKTFVDTDSTQTLTNKTWNGSLLGLNYGGTNASSASGALTNLLPSGTSPGYVLTTSGPGTFYWAAAGSGTYISGTSVVSSRVEYPPATLGQVLFTGTGTYAIGQSQLRVYINGVRQFPSAYTETSTTTFTLTTAASVGDSIFAEVDGYSTYTPVAGGITFSPTSGVGSLTVQGALAELGTEKANIDSPSFTGTPSLPTGTTATTQTAGNNTTALATTAYVDVSKANKGANGDITSLSGLTTALTVGQGGTGNTTGGATKITNSGGWSVTPSGTTLYFNYNGTNVGSLDSSGNFKAAGNITAYGTI